MNFLLYYPEGSFVIPHLRVLEENHYYPFGLKHENYNTERRKMTWDVKLEGGEEIDFKKLQQVPNSGYQYKYNGKEWQDELGLNVYDFGFRNYEPSIGRWMNIDPLAEKRYELNPYNYVQNSPLFRFDPDGLTDFTINNAGQITQIGDTNDQPDVLYQGNKKGEVLRKGEGFLGFLVRKSERGKKKIAVDKVEKGILKDGQNFKEKGEAYKIGGKGNPSREGIESFAVKLSNYLGKEIGGTYGSESSDGVITHMTIAKYENNTIDKIKSGVGQNLLIQFFDLNNTPNSLLGHYHVHPGGTVNPSPLDEASKRDWMKMYNSLSTMFFILTKSTNSKGYDKTNY